MAERRFDIIFDGSVIDGLDPSEVKSNLQALFKLDEAEVNRLFSGQPVAIKCNLDRKTATRYQSALTQAGAKIQLVLHQATSDNVPSNAHSNNAIPNTESGNESSVSTEPFALLAAGSDLLKPDERSAIEPVDIDTTHLTLDIPEETNNPFLTAENTAPLSDLQPVASYPENHHIDLETDLSAAEPGENLETLDHQPEPVTVNTDHLQTLEVDHALSDSENSSDTEENSQHELLNKIENLNVSIAEAGEDLLKDDEKKVHTPQSIDTSKLSINPISEET